MVLGWASCTAGALLFFVGLVPCAQRLWDRQARILGHLEDLVRAWGVGDEVSSQPT